MVNEVITKEEKFKNFTAETLVTNDDMRGTYMSVRTDTPGLHRFVENSTMLLYPIGDGPIDERLRALISETAVQLEGPGKLIFTLHEDVKTVVFEHVNSVQVNPALGGYPLSARARDRSGSVTGETRAVSASRFTGGHFGQCALYADSDALIHSIEFEILAEEVVEVINGRYSNIDPATHKLSFCIGPFKLF